MHSNLTIITVKNDGYQPDDPLAIVVEAAAVVVMPAWVAACVASSPACLAGCTARLVSKA